MPKKATHEMGRGGKCVCPKCDKEISHSKGKPCMEEKCPECGSKMVRKDSFHHRKIKEKREA
jgi:hypothetical protein